MLIMALAFPWIGNAAGKTPVDGNAIAEAKAGRRPFAKASWWGFDPEDATRALQSAIDSGIPKLVVDNMGSPWIVDKIQVASNLEILFEPGVEVRAKRGAFKGKGDCLFTVALKENVILRGPGATLRMWRDDYDGPEYDKAEWRHVLSIRSSTNVKVYGLTLAESGGDGIYLGVAERGVTNTNIHIKDVVCDRNYRQGISVISAKNLLIENCVMKDTAGTPPSAGIDFEPNGADEQLVNCVMRNCLTKDNFGYGYVLYIPNLTGASPPVGVRLENCRSEGDRVAFSVATSNGREEGDTHGRIDVVDCEFADAREGGVIISRKPAEGLPLRFENCLLSNLAVTQPKRSPIEFTVRAGDTRDVGGVEFVDVTIEDPVQRRPMAFRSWAGGVRVKAVTGNLTVVHNGTRGNLQISEEILKEWMPILAIKRFPPFEMNGLTFEPTAAAGGKVNAGLETVRLRRIGRYAIYAEKGNPVTVTVASLQVGKYSSSEMPIELKSPAGKILRSLKAPFQTPTEVAFTALETGLYTLTCSPGAHAVRVLSCSNPLFLGGTERPVPFFSTVGDFWFWQPAGTYEFGVNVFGEGGEGVKATLFDPAGKQIEEKDNITEPHQFLVSGKGTAQGAPWRIHIAKPTACPMEDFQVQLQGIPPLLAKTREALLKPRPAP